MSKIINSLGDITNYFYKRKLDKIIKGNLEIIFKYDLINRVKLISKRTNKSITNTNYKYEYLKTKINNEIYYFNSSGSLIKKEGRDKCRK